MTGLLWQITCTLRVSVNLLAVRFLDLFFQTTLPTFQSPEFSVTRQHEDFVWLHDTLSETEDYAGLIVSGV